MRGALRLVSYGGGRKREENGAVRERRGGNDIFLSRFCFSTPLPLKKKKKKIGFVTLLVTDGVPGLQIFDESQQQWCLVPAAAPWPPANDPGTSRPAPLSASVLGEGEGKGEGDEERDREKASNDGESEFPVFVNAGDMLHRWSNGFFKSALHRVVLAEGRDRYSAAFFFDPPWSCRVEPIAPDSGPHPSRGAPPSFPPTTYGEYLVAKFKKTHESFEAAAGEEVEKRKKRVEEGAAAAAAKK